MSLLASQQGILPTAFAGETDSQNEPADAKEVAQPNGRVVEAAPVEITAPEGGAGPAADPTIEGEPLFLPYTPPAEVTELADERTRQTRTLANPDGTFTLEASNGPLNFLDSTGAWQPIDLALAPDVTGGYKVAANAGSIRIDTAEGELGVIEIDDHRVALSAPGYGGATLGADADANTVSFTDAFGTGPEIWGPADRHRPRVWRDLGRRDAVGDRELHPRRRRPHAGGGRGRPHDHLHRCPRSARRQDRRANRPRGLRGRPTAPGRRVACPGEAR